MSESVISDDVAEALPTPTLARRDFLVGVLGAGFALAVSPVRSETVVSTDAEGLLTGEVSIPVADGELPAYRSAPKGKGPHPVILVVQEIFGVHEHIKDITRRLAKLGYLAIAPELSAILIMEYPIKSI
jgi:carboxymethylenebutenolidase